MYFCISFNTVQFDTICIYVEIFTITVNCVTGFEKLTNGSMLIQRAEIRHTGIYICVAQNSAGNSLSQVRLEVMGMLAFDPRKKLCILK